MIILPVMLTILTPATVGVGALFPARTHPSIVRERIWLWDGWPEMFVRTRAAPIERVQAFVALFVWQMIGQVGVPACGGVVTRALARRIGSRPMPSGPGEPAMQPLGRTRGA